MDLLSWLSGLLSGAAFLGGLLVGAWQQRRMKLESAAAEARKEFVRSITKDEDRYENVTEDPIGAGHPGGPVPPTFGQAHSNPKKKIGELLRTFARGNRG